MLSMKKILHHSHFQAEAFGHGGEKRTAQIVEHYKNLGYDIVELEIKYNKSLSIITLCKALKLILCVYGISHFKNLIPFLKFWKSIALSLSSTEKYFNQDIDFFVWESVVDRYYYLPYLAKKHHVKVIAYPHNIESLVPDYSINSPTLKQRQFIREMEVLRMCNEVQSISRFDNSLMQLMGVNSMFFRYLPPSEFKNYLQRIKTQRVNKVEKNRYLILGTAHNPPTRKGMIYLIDKINQMSFTEDIQFIFAGYGTEQLKQFLNSPSIQIKGSLSKEDLETEMIYCTALLVYQPSTTGALTRISEFLVAGIPVFVNAEAAHSHYEMEGVNVYSNFNEFEQILNSLKSNLNTE